MTEKTPAAIRRTVSFSPFVERMIRRTEAELLKTGWRNANFSFSLNLLMVSMYFDHTTDNEVFHNHTIRQIKRWLDRTLRLDDRDIQKWDKWIDKAIEKIAPYAEGSA